MELTKIKNPRGAGRKPVSYDVKRKSHTITMDDARWLKFKELGGTKWLDKAIDSVETKPT